MYVSDQVTVLALVFFGSCWSFTHWYEWVIWTVNYTCIIKKSFDISEMSNRAGFTVVQSGRIDLTLITEVKTNIRVRVTSLGVLRAHLQP